MISCKSLSLRYNVTRIFNYLDQTPMGSNLLRLPYGVWSIVMVQMVTWNIGGGFVSTDDHGSYKTPDIAYFADILKEISPDIVCLQEAHVSRMLDQPAWLADKLGLYSVAHAYDDSHLQPGCGLAAAILSRWAPTQSEFLTLPNPRLKLLWRGAEVISHDKGFLLARVTVEGNNVCVASGHMLPFHRFGRRLDDPMFKAVRARMESLFLQQVTDALIGADMNCADLSVGLSSLMRNYAGVPFTSTRPDGRVTDHVLYPKTWRLVCSRAALPTRADHHLCVAELVPPLPGG